MRNEEEVCQAIECYGDLIQRICLIHLKNKSDTEDIFQEVFLKYMTHPKHFESDAHEKAWFIRVTTNQCKDLLKNYFRKNKIPIESIQEMGYESDYQYLELLELLANLPEKYRSIIYLYYYEGYSCVEIAHILHIKENTVYTRLSRAKKILREKSGGEW